MTQKSVLIIGSGGREHALAWALARSSDVARVYVAPGNAGTSWPTNAAAGGLQPRAAAENVALSATDVTGLVNFARTEKIDLTVVGPEVPLVDGIGDAFQAADLPIFGPSRMAAQLEGSKAFAKAFMQQHNIPTAPYAIFTEFEEAKAFIEEAGADWVQSDALVVKADGLAAGKGVIVCDDLDHARAALKHMLVEGSFGAAGKRVIIEQRLQGREVSVLGLSDGKTIRPLLPARDHKRIFDNDRGPNTGGMGAFAPTQDVDEALVSQIVALAMQPVIAAMAAQGTPYVGVLYAGLMLTEAGPMVLEYNCRFGDPETQAVLPLLNSDLFAVFQASLSGNLDTTPINWSDQFCTNLVLASPGYPGDYYPRGLPITGVEAAAALPETLVFQAGTALNHGNLVTSGGRVLSVSALGADLPTATERAYAAAAQIHFEGVQYRKDIGR